MASIQTATKSPGAETRPQNHAPILASVAVRSTSVPGGTAGANLPAMEPVAVGRPLAGRVHSPAPQPAKGADLMDPAFFLRAGLVLAFATLLGAAFSGAAAAQNVSRAQAQAVRAACEADIRATCPGVRPGGGRILECIKANPDKISQPCKDALIAAKATSSQ
jgi:hypothetical protein